MTEYQERLLIRAQRRIAAGLPVPVDLEAAIAAEGLALDNLQTNPEEING